MLGPEGNGILYVRKKWQDTIRPAEFGWTNPANYFDYGKRDMTLRPDAGRYECGTLNTVGCYGLRAALELILEVGVPNISAAVDSLVQQVEEGVREPRLRGHGSPYSRQRLGNRQFPAPSDGQQRDRQRF